MSYPRSTQQQIFLGADVSMTHAGLVVVDVQAKPTFYEEVELSQVKGRTPPPILRVRQLHLKLRSALEHLLADERKPLWCAIEQPAYKAANMAYHLGMSMANFSGELWRHRISHFYVNPVTLKRFVTGKPMAEKEMLLEKLLDQPGYDFLSSGGRHGDLADALGLALMARCWWIVYRRVLGAWSVGHDPANFINVGVTGDFLPAELECFESERTSGRGARKHRMGLIYRPELFADFRRSIFFGSTPAGGPIREL